MVMDINSLIEERLDRSILANFASGMNTKHDIATYNCLQKPYILRPHELETLYDGSWLCQKVINKIIHESCRAWLNYQVGGAEGNSQLIAQFLKYQDDLVDEKDDGVTLKEVIKEALFNERLYGGAVIVINVDDDKKLWEPLDFNKIKAIKWMQVLNRHQVQPICLTQHGDKSKPDYYQLTGIEDLYYPESQSGFISDEREGLIHKSRVIRFDGSIKLPHNLKQQNQGWGRSVLQPFFIPFQGVETGVNGMLSILHKLDRTIMKVKGLWEIIRSKNEELLRRRMAENELFASMYKRELLDSDGEEISNYTQSASGLIELMKLFLDMASAAADLPHTFLLGESPGGSLGGTGESEQKDLNRLIGDYQTDQIDKPLRKLHKILWSAKNSPTKGKIPDDFSYSWLEPYPMTQLEKAQLEQTYASIDATNINSSVYTGDEAAMSRYGSSRYGYNITIDWEARKKQKEADANYVPEEVNYNE